MKNISIIIPHYNGEKLLQRCLGSIYNNTEEGCEIIVVDNNSSDGSVEMIEKKFPQVKTIINKTNLGYAGACNIGAKEAKHEYLFFLNNDTEVEKNWTEPLINKLKDDSVASVQPKIKSIIKKEYFDYAGASGGYIDIFGYPFCRGRIFSTIEKDNMQYEEEVFIFWASGTAFVTKKEIFIKSGMFDLTLFAHMEEIDYHWRTQMMGYKIAICPKSIIYHEGGKTLSYQSSKKTYLNHRNNLIIFLSNHKTSIVLALLIPRLILHLVSTLVDLISFKFNHFFAQIKAFLWVLLNPIYIIKKRIHNNTLKKKNYSLNGMIKKSIVFNYFILGKKHFNKY